MRYEIHNLHLIPQDQNMSCWYASAMMLIRWRQRNGTLFEPPMPTQFPEFQAHLVANNGLPQGEMVQLAQRLGLRVLPRLSRLPNPIELQTLLMMNGPLWTNGVVLSVTAAGAITPANHVVVIGGVDDVTSQILILNPWPVGRGDRSWHPYNRVGQIAAERNHRPVTFMHYPAGFR
jgi:Papain-like cysteine protease AvrRpt2